MTNWLKKEWLTLILFLSLALFYLWGMDLVPFHPDESTQIFMSQDLFDLGQDPLSLSYSPENEFSAKMAYRAIDTPLTRYLIGAGRLLTRSPSLKSDWNWSASWTENQKSGAFPPAKLLSVARTIPILLVIFSFLIFYFSVIKILPKIPALIATAFLGLNPLSLLHGRRAMAEPALLLGTTMFLWALTRPKIRPVLIGIALAVAVNAKQTGAILVPVGIIAVCMVPDTEDRLKKMLARSAVMLAVLLISSFLLNPFYWKNPLEALVISFQNRSQLLNLQLEDHLLGIVPAIPTLFSSLLYNLFISPPVVSEIVTYLPPLTTQIQAYQTVLPHTWGRGLIAGSLQITIILAGFYVVYKRYSSYPKHHQRLIKLCLLSTIVMFAGLVVVFPIPWQRYSMPLIPLLAIWLGFGFLPLSEALQTTFRSQKLPPGESE